MIAAKLTGLLKPLRLLTVTVPEELRNDLPAPMQIAELLND